MVTETAPAPIRPTRRAYPGRKSPDHFPAFWAWYIDTFRAPEVSDELYQAVEHTTKAVPAELRTELADVYTINADCGSALHFLGAGIPEVREDYQNKGLKLIQRVEGSMSRGDLRIWAPTLDSCQEVVKELRRRQRWSIAQIDGWIDEAADHLDAQLVARDEMAFWRRRHRALRARRIVVESGIPSAAELQLWFTGVERMRIQARFDRKLQEQLDLQKRDQYFAGLEAKLRGIITSGGEDGTS